MINSKALYISVAVSIICLQAVSFSGIFLYKFFCFLTIFIIRKVKMSTIKFVGISLFFIILSSIYSADGQVGVFVQVTTLAPESRYFDTFGSIIPPLNISHLLSVIFNVILAFMVVSSLNLDQKDVFKVFSWTLRFTFCVSLIFVFSNDFYQIVLNSISQSITPSYAARWNIFSFFDLDRQIRVHGFFMEPAVMFAVFLMFISFLKISFSRTMEFVIYISLLTFFSQSYLGLLCLIFLMSKLFFDTRLILIVATLVVSVVPILFDVANYGGSLAARYTFPEVDYGAFGASYLYAMSTNPIINLVVKFGFIGSLAFVSIIICLYGPKVLFILLLASSGYPNFLDFMFLFPFLMCIQAFKKPSNLGSDKYSPQNLMFQYR